MPRIKPFRGVLYNQKKAPLSKAIAPPYDVISPQEQDRFYKLHSANAIRLILGKKYYGDNYKDNRYRRAAHFYKKWLKQKTLVLDNTPSIYISRVDFKEGGKKKTRVGFIALSSLRGDKNRLLPHERTFSGPKKDRLKLMRACHTNFSQIFTLYSDPKKDVTKLLKSFMAKKPCLRVQYKGEGHCLWRLSDIKTIKKIAKIMQNKNIFIADGHHRYAVTQSFSQEMQKRFGVHGFPGSHYIMLYFSNMDEDGLSILPTHRLVRKGVIKRDRLEGLNDFFIVIPKKSITDAIKILKKNREAFCLLTKGDKSVKIFILKNRSFIRQFIKGRFSDTKKNLAATLLDEGILKGILKIDNFEKNISYTKDIKEAKRKIEQGGFSHAFLLPSTTLSELKAIASAGEKMPHKSTYFYPKLLSGLVIYDQEKSL